MSGGIRSIGRGPRAGSAAEGVSGRREVNLRGIRMVRWGSRLFEGVPICLKQKTYREHNFYGYGVGDSRTLKRNIERMVTVENPRRGCVGRGPREQQRTTKMESSVRSAHTSHKRRLVGNRRMADPPHLCLYKHPTIEWWLGKGC